MKNNNENTVSQRTLCGRGIARIYERRMRLGIFPGDTGVSVVARNIQSFFPNSDTTSNTAGGQQSVQ